MHDTVFKKKKKKKKTLHRESLLADMHVCLKQQAACTHLASCKAPVVAVLKASIGTYYIQKIAPVDNNFRLP